MVRINSKVNARNIGSYACPLRIESLVIIGMVLLAGWPEAAWYFLFVFTTGSSAQKFHSTPFACLFRGGSTPRCSSNTLAARWTLAYRYCVTSENVQLRFARLVFLNARSIC